MTLKTLEFCPAVDAVTLLQFRTEAFLAWLDAPSHQDDTWLQEYREIADMVDRSCGGPVRLKVD